MAVETDRKQREENVLQGEQGDGEATPKPLPMKRGFQFWVIIFALCVTGLLGALENTVVSTSMPEIVRDLNIGDDYVWITNAFFFTSAAVQPLFGQLANAFGRRWLTIFIVAVFTLGSGICGGANSANMLIVGRAVQGIGSGGINMIVDVIVSDLVPLRERGNFIAIVLTVYSIGSSMGPFVGGIIVQRTTWRWVFYINLPVGGFALVLLFLFLHTNYQRETTFSERIKRIDYIGNFLIMGSTAAILCALTYGGSRYAWGSWEIIVPLVLGLAGLVVFMVFEQSKFCREPVVPLRLFKNRTSLVVFINTYLLSLLLYWVLFFIPVYFQVILGSSPARAGVQMLPMTLVAIPGAVIAVIILSKFGKYKALHLAGFIILTLGIGLFAHLDRYSSDAEWIVFQVIAALGSGMILNTLLPAFQAPLAESDQAAATATWAFMRSFGNIWGVAIPASIFNNQFNNYAHRISDASVRQLLSNGHAYEHASNMFIDSLREPVKSEVIGVFSDSLKLVWEVSIAFCGLACVLVLLEKDVPLRKELETDYGMAEKDDIQPKMGVTPDIEK
ncbi:Major facilitator superfamily domain general substrate transporter [Penicillium cf. griseofulvum]|uniref:Major facilitator superfamily domain general substrate transporter n=1 Tax=Penicillium cf. griseofulvum TaxID=2972120 RepID=A0A9W9MFZ5_9EURO|nr:Major facilitator superfamily domain general substrate transporter [Penicillium cf. griseofulvum]KAJ5423985.1 Major facilitator superfamily domain general substrate transporter [Penicillium cf. griseofulvum]